MHMRWYLCSLFWQFISVEGWGWGGLAIPRNKCSHLTPVFPSVDTCCCREGLFWQKDRWGPGVLVLNLASHLLCCSVSRLQTHASLHSQSKASLPRSANECSQFASLLQIFMSLLQIHMPLLPIYATLHSQTRARSTNECSECMYLLQTHM